MKLNWNIVLTGSGGNCNTFSASTLGGWNSGGCVDSRPCVDEKVKSVPMPMNHVLKEMQETFGHRKFRMGQVRD